MSELNQDNPHKLSYAENRGTQIPTAASIVNSTDPHRDVLENFIQRVFQQQYGARVQHCMPQLLGLRSTQGQLLAALGLRQAASTRLFLEQYLIQPVESVLNARLAAFHPNIQRYRIMEVGNLAARHSGGARWLIIALTAYLQGAGYDWVVFTAVPTLRNSFRKLGLHMIHLGSAERSALPANQQAEWGSYYDSNPQVMAVNVHHTYGVLERYLRLEQAVFMLHSLWHTAYGLGVASLLPSQSARHDLSTGGYA